MALYRTFTFKPLEPIISPCRSRFSPLNPFPIPIGMPAILHNTSLIKNTKFCHLKMNFGDPERDTGVVGNASGDPSLDWSNECDCESGGVWQRSRQSWICLTVDSRKEVVEE